jgi:hypothetical protein
LHEDVARLEVIMAEDDMLLKGVQVLGSELDLA